MRQVLREDVCQARHDVLPARLQRGVAESREGVRFVEAVVMKTPADEEAMIFAKTLVETRRKLVRVQPARRGKGKGSGGGIRSGDELGEEQRLRREPGGRDDIVRELRAGERVVDPSRS